MGEHFSINESMLFSLGAILALSFCIALGALFFSHLWLLAMNLTSIEVGYRGKNPYNLGIKQNSQQIMGSLDITWLLPIHSSRPVADGLSYPVCKEAKQAAAATELSTAIGQPELD